MLNRVYASIGVYSNSLSAETLAEKLDLPTHSLRLVHKGRRSPLGIAENSAVLLSSREEVESCDLDDHFSWLLEQLGKSYDFLKTSQEIFVRCYVFFESDTANGEVFISTEIMNQLSGLRCSLSIDAWMSS